MSCYKKLFSNKTEKKQIMRESHNACCIKSFKSTPYFPAALFKALKLLWLRFYNQAERPVSLVVKSPTEKKKCRGTTHSQMARGGFQ